MTIRLTLDTAPHSQAETTRDYLGGTLVIGRGDDADWQLNDPDMYVSRRHCILSDETGTPMVTDASSGGLYIDNSANPVGTGNSVPLEDGMRLRLGDFVLRVEMNATDAPAQRENRTGPGIGFEFSFGEAPEANGERVTTRAAEGEAAPPRAKPEPSRPENLPPPFDPFKREAAGTSEPEEARPLPPLEREDPFGLDLRKPVVEPAPEPASSGGKSDIFGDFTADFGARPAEPEEPETPQAPTPEQPAAARPATGHDSGLREAFLRGAGLDPAQVPAEDPIAEMEALGARMRELVDGLMMLLRARAQEKQRARVAQTVMASENVNPLKFLATSEDALTALIRPRGKGYLAPDQAVPWAFRDLADHQMRTWSGLQAALRRMIDRFDPAEIEKEAETLGLLEKIIAGGKSAKMWEMYQEHYRDLAKAAEEQFLGEVGSDFRDAYESRKE